MTEETVEIDVFWSFKSPWSYLATPRRRQWQDQYQLKVNFRPVYPLAIRTPEFFHTRHPHWFSSDAPGMAIVREVRAFLPVVNLESP